MLPRIRDLLLTRINPIPIPGTSNLSAETLNEMKSSILDLLHEVVGAGCGRCGLHSKGRDAADLTSAAVTALNFRRSFRLYQPVTTAPLNFSVTNCLTSGEW